MSDKHRDLQYNTDKKISRHLGHSSPPFQCPLLKRLRHPCWCLHDLCRLCSYACRALSTAVSHQSLLTKWRLLAQPVCWLEKSEGILNWLMLKPETWDKPGLMQIVGTVPKQCRISSRAFSLLKCNWLAKPPVQSPYDRQSDSLVASLLHPDVFACVCLQLFMSYNHKLNCTVPSLV